MKKIIRLSLIIIFCGSLASCRTKWFIGYDSDKETKTEKTQKNEEENKTSEVENEGN
ncbi:hypothetical protein [Christiangramia fulva]|uniref:hypothetical protein n=1 Tax=Christiangramia fulva TaxID=2126553 RepID=UPI00131C1B2A|nr:hypothetical protein [Christiangramia fulva]